MGQVAFQEAVNKRIKICQIVLNALNAMEAFSVYFIKEVADEEIAFSSIGRTFVYSVETYYFDLCYIIGDDNENSFSKSSKIVRFVE
jgi:hypothetical protein